MDERIEAVRADPVVGRGTCSGIAECWSDDELLELFSTDGVAAAREAVVVAREIEEARLEQATNCREGLDTDPQLTWLDEFYQACADNPVEVKT